MVDRSPLPGAPALDAAIEASLARFDAIPRPVRDAAWAVAQVIQRLSYASALRIVAFAHRVANEERQR